MITVTPIETGKARMKTAQQTGRDGRGPIGRKIDIFRDRNWVDPLPILCFLIDHPEGRFLVDTGDTWRNSVPGYLPRWHPFFKEVVIKVAPLEEVGPNSKRWRSIRPATLPPSSSTTAITITPAALTTFRTIVSSLRGKTLRTRAGSKEC